MSSRGDRIFNLIQRFNVAADNAIGSLRNESSVPLVDRLRMFQRSADSAPRRLQQRPPRTRVHWITLRLSVLSDHQEQILMPTRGTSIKKIFVPLSMNENDFHDLLTRTFPVLRAQEIELCKVDRHRRIIPLQIAPITPATIKANTGAMRSAIYIRIKPTIQQEPSETVPSDLPFTEINTAENATTQQEPSGTIVYNEAHQVQSSDTALAEWRALRREQDEEYERSLSIDRAREMRRRQVEALEADRRRVSVNHCAIRLFMYFVVFVTCLKHTVSKIIHERRQLVDTCGS